MITIKRRKWTVGGEGVVISPTGCGWLWDADGQEWDVDCANPAHAEGCPEPPAWAREEGQALVIALAEEVTQRDVTA